MIAFCFSPRAGTAPRQNPFAPVSTTPKEDLTPKEDAAPIEDTAPKDSTVTGVFPEMLTQPVVPDLALEPDTVVRADSLELPNTDRVKTGSTSSSTRSEGGFVLVDDDFEQEDLIVPLEPGDNVDDLNAQVESRLQIIKQGTNELWVLVLFACFIFFAYRVCIRALERNARAGTPNVSVTEICLRLYNRRASGRGIQA